jgi:hypothetical protein
MKTIAKQQNFNPGPPFFGFKHKKLFLNPITKHAFTLMVVNEIQLT